MDAKERAREAFDAVEPDLDALNRWMYDHPELAFEEKESSARLAGHLAEAGFEVEYPAFGIDTAFVAGIGSGSRHVVICAEYDALPGIGHACGHNIIATAALGAGAALQPLVDDLGIRLTVLGTPAEEKYGGKADLIEAGAFEGVTAAMMIHPSPVDVVDPRVISVTEIEVDFHGRSAHASAYPHLGINALDAAVQAYVNMSTLRQQLYPTDKVHGVITHGGEAPNIIPAHTRSSWYVRAEDRQRLDALLPRVRACFEGAALATGCSHEVTQVGNIYEDIQNNPTMVELFAANANRLGRQMMRGHELPPSQSGSTDMGNVSKVVPSIHPMLGIASAPAVNHQPEFAAHTLSDDGRKAIRDGALGMAWTVIDLAERDLWDRL